MKKNSSAKKPKGKKKKPSSKPMRILSDKPWMLSNLYAKEIGNLKDHSNARS